MSRIGILAGGGKLPLIIGESLLKKDYDIFFFGFEDFVDFKIYKKYNFKKISLNSFSNIIGHLRKYKIDQIIMAGNVKRPSIKDIKFDLNTLKIIKKYLLQSKGDDKLLSCIADFFEEKGYPVFNWIRHCEDLFEDKVYLTNKKPSKNADLNKLKGLQIFDVIGNTDIAQSLIIQNQLILGIEAAEGTDELIKRCYSYKKKGDDGILIKLSKFHQNSYLDIPTIGLQTVKNIKKNNFEGIFLERKKCIIIEKQKVIDFCNINGIFISTVIKI